MVLFFNVRSQKILKNYFLQTVISELTLDIRYLIVEAREATLRGEVVSVVAVCGEELPTLATQCVHTTLQVDVEARVVVDGEFSLPRQVVLLRVQLANAILHQMPVHSEVHLSVRHQRRVQQRAVDAVCRSGNVLSLTSS